LSGILVTYIYLRYKWGTGHDMDQMQAELSERFNVGRRDFPGNEIEVSLFKEDRVELIVTADRMRVHANAHRAILSQIEEGAFTKHDMELREYVLENYPRSRPTPFPWSHNFEPKFMVEE
jgi:hypothetical protein